MSAVRLALIGIGNVRCGASILATLAGYFGERPFEIRLYDSDLERLDGFDRFARKCFLASKAPHSVMSTESPEEALADADLIVVSMSRNCASRLLKSREVAAEENSIEQAIQLLKLQEHPEASILSLQREPIAIDGYYHLNWPAELSEEDRASFPLQLLRWLNEEEYPFDLMRACKNSPFKAWLDNPTTADYVQSS